MKRIFLLLLSFTTISIFSQNCAIVKNPVENHYFKTTIIDDYRNLEKLDDSTINWISCQNDYTRKTLSDIKAKDSLSKTFYDRLKARKDSNFSFKNNNKYFYCKRLPNETYAKLFLKVGANDEILVYDPKSYKSESGKQYLISYYKVNNAENKVAIALTEGGKEVSEMIIYDLTTKTTLSETVQNSWPSEMGGISWLPDDSGFIYTRMSSIDNKDPNFLFDSKSCLHLLNSKEEDKVIFSRILNPELNIKKEDFPIVQIKQNYLIGFLGGATKYKDSYYVSIEDLKKEKLEWKPLFRKDEKITTNYFIKGDDIFFVTNNKEISKKNLKEAVKNENKTLIITKKEEFLSNIIPVKQGFYFTTLKNGIEAHLYFYNSKKVKEIKLPFETGNIGLQNIEDSKSDIWVFCSGWTQRTKIFKYDINKNTFTEEKFNTSTDKYNDLIVEEIEIKTHDGLLMPISIIRNKNIKKDKKTRTIIDSYGSYGAIESPAYYENILEWVYNGGMYVFAHIRGGGEKGDDWYKGGFKKTKSNSWKDVISCAEFLIQKEYTSPIHLGLTGVSAGGIAIGRAITERPDLFKAVVIKVGILNPVRLEATPNGTNNVKEFGSIAIEDEFNALYEMDSYLHLKTNTVYPASLITAGMNDARVIVWQPAKFVAKMQDCQKGENPILFRVNMEGGHGGSVAVNKTIEENVDVYSFFYWQLGHPDFQIKK